MDLCQPHIFQGMCHITVFHWHSDQEFTFNQICDFISDSAVPISVRKQSLRNLVGMDLEVLLSLIFASLCVGWMICALVLRSATDCMLGLSGVLPVPAPREHGSDSSSREMWLGHNSWVLEFLFNIGVTCVLLTNLYSFPGYFTAWSHPRSFLVAVCEHFSISLGLLPLLSAAGGI